MPFLSGAGGYEEGEGAGAWNLREVCHQFVDIAFTGREEVTLAEALQYVDEHGPLVGTHTELPRRDCRPAIR